MTESLQTVIKRLKKFNYNYLNNQFNKHKLIGYGQLCDFCDIYLLKKDKVFTINRDGTRSEDYKTFDDFNECFKFDTFLVYNIEKCNIECEYKTHPKNNTILFGNFKHHEINTNYALSYLVTFDIFGKIDPVIKYLRRAYIPIIDYNNQTKIAHKFEKLYEVIMFLEKQVESNNL